MLLPQNAQFDDPVLEFVFDRVCQPRNRRSRLARLLHQLELSGVCVFACLSFVYMLCLCVLCPPVLYLLYVLIGLY